MFPLGLLCRGGIDSSADRSSVLPLGSADEHIHTALASLKLAYESHRTGAACTHRTWHAAGRPTDRPTGRAWQTFLYLAGLSGFRPVPLSPCFPDASIREGGESGRATKSSTAGPAGLGTLWKHEPEGAVLVNRSDASLVFIFTTKTSLQMNTHVAVGKIRTGLSQCRGNLFYVMRISAGKVIPVVRRTRSPDRCGSKSLIHL